MYYTEYIPTPALQHIVKTIWVLEDISAGTNNYEKILPDGCCEMIFHLGEPMLQKENELEIKQDRHFVYGQLSKYIELKSSGPLFVIGVKFHPWGLAALTNIPQYELNQQRIKFTDIFNEVDKFIFEKVDDLNVIVEKIKAIQDFLLDIHRRIKAKTDHRAVQFAINQLSESNGMEKIASISRAMNISSRELERKFKKDIGLGPKQIARIYHFQSVLQLKSKTGSLTDLAHSAGYYDQSHFIREFRDIAGVNPRDFFNEEKRLTDVFVDKKF